MKTLPSGPVKTRTLTSLPDLKKLGLRLSLTEILSPGFIEPLGDGEADSLALDFSLKETFFVDLSKLYC